MINFAVLIAKISLRIACFIFGLLSLIPAAYLPTGLFDRRDKAQHILAFFCKSSLGVMAYQKATVRIAIGLLLYGGLIDISKIPKRPHSGELANWVADGIGILIGFF